MTKKTVTVDDLARFTCDCGGKISLGEDVATGEAMAFHSLPECEWFVAATSKDLLEAWRKKTAS